MQEVPRPSLPPGGVLVRTTHSVISIGTEKMKVEQARMNLLQKARARPDQVRKVLDTARNLGWKAALEKVRNRLETPTPLGYSAAGVVLEVDPLNTRFRVGDRGRAWTGGYGVDAAVICTATQSNAPIEQAADAVRDRARFVIVGNTRADLAWKVFYEKELEIRYSRSYGPGRYDPSYEWGGSDYPIGYVRWTEQRNFQACLNLMAKGQINLAAITTRRAPFKSAPAVYQDLLREGGKDVGVVLEYGDASVAGGRWSVVSPAKQPRPTVNCQRPADKGRWTEAVSRLDVIGAGNFARTML